MPDAPKQDLDKVLRTHRSLKQYRERRKNEWIHRVLIAALAVTGFIGTITINHLGTLLCIAVIYFIVALWQGWITLRLPRVRARDKYSGDQDSENNKGAPSP